MDKTLLLLGVLACPVGCMLAMGGIAWIAGKRDRSGQRDTGAGSEN